MVRFRDRLLFGGVRLGVNLIYEARHRGPYPASQMFCVAKKRDHPVEATAKITRRRKVITPEIFILCCQLSLLYAFQFLAHTKRCALCLSEGPILNHSVNGAK